MTEGFNIDLDADGFRKNHLDWRKFRDNYNRVSATKVERGIKPLPFSLILKLFGSQKIFNTFVIRRDTDDIDTNLIPLDSIEKDPEMNQGEMAITNTLNFPGQGILNTSSEERNETLLKGTKQLKRDALPIRPAFQRNIRVPGRYFPKPSQTVEDNLNLSIAPYESARDRPRTQTPRSIQSHSSAYSFGGSTSHSGKGFRNHRIARGPVCKVNDSLTSNPGRTQTWSGKSSTTTIKSIPIDTNGFLSVRKTATANVSEHRADLYSNSIKSEENDLTLIGNGSANGEIQGDLFTVQRPKHSARQVSFPKTSADFSAVLHGRPKTLHRRELTDSLDVLREPRARTHVGFADTDL